MNHGNKSKAKMSSSRTSGEQIKKASSSSAAAAHSARVGPAGQYDARRADSAQPEFSTSRPLRLPEESNGQPSRSSVFGSTVDNSLYFSYKERTKRFQQGLLAMVPKGIIHSEGPRSFIEATDYVAKRGLEVATSLLDDLKHAIRERRQVAHCRYWGGDDKHAHFIDVLEYCWSILAPLRKSRIVNRPESEPSWLQTGLESHSAGDISESDSTLDDGSRSSESNGDDDDEMDLPQSPLPHPVETELMQLSTEEIINGTDLTRTVSFLMTLETLMGWTAAEFQSLNQVSKMIQRKETPPRSLIQLVMEASVAANFSIQQAARVEKAFIRDHPHLNTAYRVFAVLALFDQVQPLTERVTTKSPIATQFTEQHAVAFLGDAVECSFRSPSDPMNKRLSLVTEFLEHWQFHDTATSPGEMTVQKIFDHVQARAAHEVAHDDDATVAVPCRQPNHSWLPATYYKYIGKNRSITHTIHLLQCESHSISSNRDRIASHWFMRTRSADQIQLDMVDLAVDDILPSLFTMCREGMLASDLPLNGELLTGFVHISQFAKSPERQVSWALAFTVHTILTGIFELQESNHFTFLAQTAQQSYQKFFDQLEWVETMCPCTIPHSSEHREVVKSLRLLPVTNIDGTSEGNITSIWNPYCAGTFLSYLSYFGNLERGTSLVDSVGQLRMTLFLFHALKRIKAIRRGQIRLLEWAFNRLEGWLMYGGLPSKGQFRVSWYMSLDLVWALRAQAAQLTGDAVDTSIKDSAGPKALRPTDISSSFQSICLPNVVAIVGNHHYKRKRKKVRSLDFFHLLTCGALVDMVDDERLLGTNLICLGFFMKDFFVKLCHDLGWMSIVEARVANATDALDDSEDNETQEERQERLTFHYMKMEFAVRVVKALDSGNRSIASVCAQSMSDYFNNIPLENLMWFAPERM